MRRILKISGQCLSWLLSVLTHSCSLAGRYLSRLLTLALNVTVSPEVLPGAPLEGMPNVDWVFRVGAMKSVHMSIAIVYSFVSST